MKTFNPSFAAADKKNFEALRLGQKTVETRAATKKYREVMPGDTFVATCNGQKIEMQVKSVKTYPSIDLMFEEIPLALVMPDVKTVEEARRAYYGYQGYEEKLAEHGVIAFHIELVRRRGIS
jgi:ASC-1-like (ASCH) protein